MQVRNWWPRPNLMNLANYHAIENITKMLPNSRHFEGMLTSFSTEPLSLFISVRKKISTLLHSIIWNTGIKSGHWVSENYVINEAELNKQDFLGNRQAICCCASFNYHLLSCLSARVRVVYCHEFHISPARWQTRHFHSWGTLQARELWNYASE